MSKARRSDGSVGFRKQALLYIESQSISWMSRYLQKDKYLGWQDFFFSLVNVSGHVDSACL
jgi:hypothetical protein